MSKYKFLSHIKELVLTLVIFILLYLIVSTLGILRLILPFSTTQINQIELFLASLSALIISIKLFEKKFINDTVLSFKDYLKNTLLGSLYGFLLISSCVAIFFILGWYRIISINSFNIKILITAMLITYVNASFQEIISRGIIFRKIEELTGTWIALIIDLAAFSLLHLANSGTTLYQAFSIGIIGSLFTISYIFSRNLWLPISMHFAWNFFQGYLWGLPISGGTPHTERIFNQNMAGISFLTGGTFGPEGGLIALLLFLIIDGILINKIIKQKKYLTPIWKKSFLEKDNNQ